MLFLGVFAIDICAYAVMSNHLHVVLHINAKKVAAWSTLDVLKRWHKLHKGTLFTQQYVRGESLSDYAMGLVEASAEAYRSRLMLREFNKEKFKSGPNDFSEAAKGSALYCVRMTAMESLIGKPGFWTDLFDCYWPCGLIDDGAVVVY